MGGPLKADVLAEISALARRGLTPSQVRARMRGRAGSSTVYRVMGEMLERGDIANWRQPRQPRQPQSQTQHFTFCLTGPDRIAALDAAAAPRGLTRTALVARLVSVVVDDGLIDGILDDKDL